MKLNIQKLILAKGWQHFSITILRMETKYSSIERDIESILNDSNVDKLQKLSDLLIEESQSQYSTHLVIVDGLKQEHEQALTEIENRK